jgi:8-oxo-dGTP pyrophosphatase MutT (NUDIX family)
MDSHQSFTEQIKKALHSKLPGQKAQFQMMPEGRNVFDEKPNPQLAAVLILLYPVNNIIHTIFIRRSEFKGFHSGQISFPGGKKENSDSDLIYTALRESSEEIGIKIADVEIMGGLTKLYIPNSNYDVHPFVGYIKFKPEWETDINEVKYIIEVPLKLFYNPNIRKKEKWNVNGSDIIVPFFNVKDNKIWGATAMILNEFLNLIPDGNIFIMPVTN